MGTESKIKQRAKCGLVYSPSAPVERLQLFADRIDAVRSVAKAMSTRGKHAILYGEPGVGKTSLAMVMKEVFDDVEAFQVYRVNCTERDSFHSVWMRNLSQIRVIHEPTEGAVRDYTLDQYVGEDNDLSPGDISPLIRRVCDVNHPMVLIFDEFNRLDPKHRSCFADTIKDLSDNSINATIMLVGVAGDVTELVIEHSSITRCLSQIRMLPMSRDELGDIITRANVALSMTMESRAIDLIISLSQGFAHYTHLIAQEATYITIDDERDEVTLDDVNNGIVSALTETDQTLREDYYKAIEGQRKGTIFSKVLLACALAEVNELSEFNSAAVRDPLNFITGGSYKTTDFASHMNKFCHDPTRGRVLLQTGSSRRYRYKFRNPLLRPFTLMKGITNGLISGDLVTNWASQRVSDPPPGSAPLYGA